MIIYLPHVTKVAPVLVGARVPYDDARALQERVIQVLAHIQINEVAEVVVHVDAGVQLYHDHRLADNNVALAGLNRPLGQPLEVLELAVPGLEGTLVCALPRELLRVEPALAADVALGDCVLAVAVV